MSPWISRDRRPRYSGTGTAAVRHPRRQGPGLRKSRRWWSLRPSPDNRVTTRPTKTQPRGQRAPESAAIRSVGVAALWDVLLPVLYQVSLIMTHRDRAGDPPGRRKAAGDAGHRQGFPTPSGGSPARPEAASQGFRPGGGRRPAWLAMLRIAAPRAPGRKPWETVSMGHYQRDLVLHRGDEKPVPRGLPRFGQTPGLGFLSR